MSESKIELKSIQDLLEMKFFIPSYQRGYRWTEQQVRDLLDDVWEFSQNMNKNSSEFYCLQPLVVKRKEEDILRQIKDAKTIEEVKTLLKGYWEVIDGQQRLTTIFILLDFLHNEDDKQYKLSYETREEFDKFLSESKENFNKQGNIPFEKIVAKNNDWNNIDFYHIFIAYKTIRDWFSVDNDKKTPFKKTLLNNVKFIWYETDEEDPIKVFTRLNIGKISLTNAELIKALFLNSSNFGNEKDEHLRLRQQEIASEWDNIEYTLQNDEFWLFLHEKGYDRPTRIDFIFDLICEQKSLGKFENIGTDEYKTFRYFYEYFKSVGEEQEKSQDNAPKVKIESCWAEVKKYFQTFQEWFNDLELYHYVGYLIACNTSAHIKDLYCNYISNCETKDSFKDYLKNKIQESINLGSKKLCDENDLNKSLHYNTDKELIRKILLLHNVQSVIKQNNGYKNKKEYNLPVFYKFPFHLFKKETWNVEHIDSDSTNDLSKLEQQREWVASVYFFNKDNLQDLDCLCHNIKDFLFGEESENKFESLQSEIEKKIKTREYRFAG